MNDEFGSPDLFDLPDLGLDLSPGLGLGNSL